MAAGDVEVNITSPNAKPGAIFDGVNDYILTPGIFNRTREDWTVSLWIRDKEER